MKYSLLVLSAVGLATNVFGQHDAENWKPVSEKTPSHQPLHTVSKTTGLTERLSAIATYKPGGGPSGVLTDSVNYKYSGIRSSHFDFNKMRYYDSSNMTNILFDTAWYYKTSGGNMVGVRKVGGEYTANNKLLAQVTDVAIGGNFFQHLQSDSFFYNTNSTLGRQRHFTWATHSSFDTAFERLYAYTSQGKLSQDVLFTYGGNLVFNPTSMRDYKYNAAGKEDTIVNMVYVAGSWKQSSRTFFDYYPGDLLRKYTTQNYVGSAWVNSVKDSFGYGAFNFYNYYEHQTWSGSQWVNAIKDVRHANALGVTDSQYVSYWNATTQTYNAPTVTSWIYDSLFRPTRSVKYDSVGGFVDSMKYYYETYNNPISVPVVTVAHAIVYPNPASNTLYIKWDATTNAPGNITIVNTQGQLVKSKNTNGEAETTIQVSDLAPGMYWIRGVNKDGKENFHASFLKK